jgi:hypothetical protein
MSEQDPELEAFSKFIVAMEPWLGEVVLVGGWAHRLYRLDPRARKLDYPILRKNYGGGLVVKDQMGEFMHDVVGSCSGSEWNSVGPNSMPLNNKWHLQVEHPRDWDGSRCS